MKPLWWPSTQHTSAMAIAIALAVGSSTMQATGAEATAKARTQVPVKAVPLDLRLGNLPWLFDSREFTLPLPEELEEIIVHGRRPEPLPEHRVIPSGLGALAYGLMNPAQAWRILVPDPNVWIADRSVDDVPEAPGAYRAKILAPGRISD